MNKTLVIAAAMAVAFAANGQDSPSTPLALTDGTNTLAVNQDDYQQVYYLSYTASQDLLLSLTIPTAEAKIVASNEPGDKYQSDITLLSTADFGQMTTNVKCMMAKDEILYLKVTLQTYLLPANATSTVVTAETAPYVICYGETPSDAIDLNVSDPAYLPLTALNEEPYGLKPVYASYTAPQDGWLYLRFKPSITQIMYAHAGEDTYTNLKHEYVLEDNRTVGAKALLQVTKGEQLVFKITGFNASMVSLTVENPEPGTSWDFPIDVTPGELMLPAEAGEYFYRIAPDKEGFIEITSESTLPGGFVEVTFDSNGTGAFYIYDYIHLRKEVYSRMEYIVHFSKAVATATEQAVDIKIAEAEACDDRFDGQLITPGERYSTIPFAGTYYYRIEAPADGTYRMSLTTLEQPASPDTRANLFTTDDRTLSVARGLDMTCDMQPGAQYILEWTVFDIDRTIPFKVEFTPTDGIEEITAGASSATICHDLQGRRVSVPARGIYIINGRKQLIH